MDYLNQQNALMATLCNHNFFETILALHILLSIISIINLYLCRMTLITSVRSIIKFFYPLRNVATELRRVYFVFMMIDTFITQPTQCCGGKNHNASIILGANHKGGPSMILLSNGLPN